jgi:hypothetical protein
MIYPFSSRGATSSIIAGAASANTALAGPTDESGSVRVHNSGTNPVFVAFGASAVAATTADYVIGAGTTEVFSLPIGVTHWAAIAPTGTPVVYAQRGGGL